MAPSRKSRSVNKRFPYINESSPSKDVQTASKSGKRRRKLSDMLGPQWSKEELEHFYEAYRKYGKDWKKVAAVIRNRSVEMVEALYTMNRAYLSLPEGTASMVGLIAMMTDHYSVMGGSESEQESNDGTEASQKPQKRDRANIQNNILKGSEEQLPIFSQSQSAASTYGCLSLLKKRRSGSRPRAVGKRTPRVPISFSYEKVKGEKHISPAKQGLKPKLDVNDVDDDVAHEIALALTEASQRGDSPQVSRTLKRKTEAVPPALRNKKQRHGDSELSSTKLCGESDEVCCELSLGSTEADNGYYTRGRNNLMGADGASIIEVQQGRRYSRKKPEVEESLDNHCDDIKEACSGTEEGQTPDDVKRKIVTEVADSKTLRSSKGPKKKSQKIMFRGDEGIDFNPLQALADLSLMMPTTHFDTESYVQINEENIDVDKSKERGHRSSLGSDLTTRKISKHGKVMTRDVISTTEAVVGTLQFTSGMRKRKPVSKVTDEVKNFVTRGKRSHSVARPKQGKLGKAPELASSDNHPECEGKDASLSKVPNPAPNHANVVAKVRSRRKLDIQKPLIPTELKSSENTKKLANFVSWYQARRWCAFEWFYSALDYPWFAKKEFVEYLDHVGLNHVPGLTRVEWGVIRSSLGRPRRFSDWFLKEEMEKLNQYRESVRAHYTELRNGTREGLPTDLAQPLSVGQHVIAVHPRTREIHNGSVLTVDHNRCLVQLDQPELGVKFVMDIDCMPLNPSESMPVSLATRCFSTKKALENFYELKMNGLSKEELTRGMKFSSVDNLENIDSRAHTSPSKYINSSMQPKGDLSSVSLHVEVGCKESTISPQPATSQLTFLAQIQAKEADIQALFSLTCALDKKEAIVSELKYMNDDVFQNQKDGGDNSLKDLEVFKKKYAEVLFQLNDINEQVASALFCLRQRNTYQGNSGFTWLKSMDGSGQLVTLPNSFDYSLLHCQESGPHVAEIVENSRIKARLMVHSAMQAMSSLKEKGNDIGAIEDAIDFVNNRLLVGDLGSAGSRSSTLSEPAHGTPTSQDQLTACTSTTLAAGHAPESKLDNSSEHNEPQIPSELIAQCVATLLMIQTCTERQFPPADVAQVLDSAVTTLQPCCSQNLPVYAEIQKCMGIIKSQILALIPS